MQLMDFEGMRGLVGDSAEEIKGMLDDMSKRLDEFAGNGVGQADEMSAANTASGRLKVALFEVQHALDALKPDEPVQEQRDDDGDGDLTLF